MFTQDPFLKRNEKGVLNLVDRVLAAPNQEPAMLYLGNSGDANKLITDQSYSKTAFTGIEDLIEILYCGSIGGSTSAGGAKLMPVAMLRSICSSFEEEYKGRIFHLGLGDKNGEMIGFGTGTITSVDYTGENNNCSASIVGTLASVPSSGLKFSQMKVIINLGTVTLTNLTQTVIISPIFIENNFFNASAPVEKISTNFLYAPTTIGSKTQVLVGGSSPAQWNTVGSGFLYVTTDTTINQSDILENPFGLMVFIATGGITLTLPEPADKLIPNGYKIRIECSGQFTLASDIPRLRYGTTTKSSFISSNCELVELTKICISADAASALRWQINEVPKAVPLQFSTGTTTLITRAKKWRIIDNHTSGTLTLNFSSVTPESGDVIELWKVSTSAQVSIVTKQFIRRTTGSTVSKEISSTVRSYMKLVYDGAYWNAYYGE